MKIHRVRALGLALGLALNLTGASFAWGQSLEPATQQAVDEAVAKVLKDRNLPSASIAIVKDGHIAYAKAYGLARLDPATPATADMRYKIASNSKQLTAAAILLLAEQHKLSLDDRLSRFLPELSRAKDISLRQLLAHTSGYPDYYAQDYLLAPTLKDTTAQAILDGWAKGPLVFEPGTRYQYSNTGYVVLGEVVRKVSGQPLFAFLHSQVFDKLGMKSATNSDADGLGPADPLGYTRYALGPVQPAKSEGRGWMDSAGELAMTASDLARWDIALMNGSVLSKASTKAMTTSYVLTDGSATNYGLGIGVSQMPNGHRRWAHSGEVSGFLSANITFPDDRMALVVLTNGEGDSFNRIAKAVEKLLFNADDVKAPVALERAKAVFESLRKGQLDRSILTDDLNAYFNETALKDFASSLAPLGEVRSFTESRHSDRGGMTARVYAVETEKGKLNISTYVMPDGRLEQFLVSGD